MRATRGGALSRIVVLEVFRQGAFLAAHTCVGVPIDWHFVTKHIEMEWCAGPPLATGQEALYESTLEVSVAAQEKRGEPYYLDWSLVLGDVQYPIAVGAIQGWVLASPRYRAMRRSSLASDVADEPTTASEAPGGADPQVSWDENDPFLFNRRGDHVVSMALIEAVLVALRGTSSTDVDRVGFSMDFLAFAERTSPITLRMGAAVMGEQVVELRQRGQTIARAFGYAAPMSEVLNG